MTKKRKQRFIEAVAEAARRPAPRRRGRPVVENLSVEGRVKGLEAMQSAPRCTARRRNGHPCRAPALKGATKCVKHGGRVQVPDHPHNIRRFFGGELSLSSGSWRSDLEFWDGLTLAERREVIEVVPAYVLKSSRRLYAAAREWMEIRDAGYPALRRFQMKYPRA